MGHAAATRQQAKAPLEYMQSPVPAKVPNTRRKNFLIVATVILVLTFLYISFYAYLSGGYENVWRSLKPAPNPNSSSLVQKREQAIKTIDMEFSAVDSIPGLTVYGTSTHDLCSVGQNNIKVQQGYSHRCMYRKTKIYSVDKQSFNLARLTQTVRTNGWYQQQPASTNTNSPDVRLPKYVKQEATLQGIYVVSPAELEQRDIFSLEDIQRVDVCCSFSYDAEDFQDILAAVESIGKRGNGLLMVAIEEQYFRN